MPLKILPPPRYYVYLDAVARCGSIRKAAEQLHVASTALNRKINELEENIGTPLFERLPRGVRLTAAGEVLLATVRKGMSDLRAAVSQIEHLRGQIRGTVRIGGAESVCSDLIPRSIARYQQAHSGVQFHVVTGVTEHLTTQLLNDDVDLILVHQPSASDQLAVLASIVQPLCAVMRPDHPLATRESVRIADCQKYPLALSDTSFASRRMIDAIAAKSSVGLHISMQASTIHSLKEFTKASGAICFQFKIGTLSEVARGELVAIPLVDRALSGTSLSLVCRAGRVLPVAPQAFARTLQQMLELAAN